MQNPISPVGTPLGGNTSPIVEGMNVNLPPAVPSVPQGAGEPAAAGTPGVVNLPQTQEPAPIQSPAEVTPDGLIEVRIDNEVVKVPLDELKQGYSRQADYTRKTQALAADRESLKPAQELYQYLQDNPQAVQAIEQTLGQQGAQGGFQPGQPMPDPAVNQQITSMQQQMADQTVTIEMMQFKAVHPEADANKVLDHAVTRGIPNLDDAYKALMYDELKSQGPVQVQNAVQQGQAAQVETRGAQQAPPTQTIDVRGKTPQELFALGSKVFGPLTNP